MKCVSECPLPQWQGTLISEGNWCQRIRICLGLHPANAQGGTGHLLGINNMGQIAVLDRGHRRHVGGVWQCPECWVQYSKMVATPCIFDRHLCSWRFLGSIWDVQRISWAPQSALRLTAFQTLSDLAYMFGPWLLQLHSSVYLININKWCLIWAESSSPLPGSLYLYCSWDIGPNLAGCWAGQGLLSVSLL